ncbi:MAG: hypothetical protein QOG62_2020 [Thermoleophilaceae bacterium]|jgi:hypothetical protein|nr:hypothetical protein [Thermoleophilaceae bacterium]
MTDSPSSGGTSVGALVAAGDERAFRAYHDAREPAVQAYTSRVCSLEESFDATVNAIFMALKASPDLAGVSSNEELDALLLRITRVEASARAATDAPAPAGRVAPIGQALARKLGRDEACKSMPTLLAARAAGDLSDADLEQVERHLAGCSRCTVLAARFDRAEEAFAARQKEVGLPTAAEVAAGIAPRAPVAPPSPPKPSPPPAAATPPAPTPPAASAPPPKPATPPSQQAGPPPAAPAPPAASTPSARPAPAVPVTPIAAFGGPLPARRISNRMLLVGLLVIVVLAAGAYLLFGRAPVGSSVQVITSPSGTTLSKAEQHAARTTPLFDKSNIQVAVLDSASDPKAAKVAAQRLKAGGLTLGPVGQAGKGVKQTTVVYDKDDPEAEREALAVKRKLLPLRSVLQQGAPSDEIQRTAKGMDILVLAGPDILK